MGRPQKRLNHECVWSKEHISGGWGIEGLPFLMISPPPFKKLPVFQPNSWASFFCWIYYKIILIFLYPKYSSPHAWSKSLLLQVAETCGTDLMRMWKQSWIKVGVLNPAFLCVLSWYRVARQINATTFWTFGCAVWGCGPQTANRKSSINLRLTLKESPERCHYPMYGSPLKRTNQWQIGPRYPKYTIRTRNWAQPAV